MITVFRADIPHPFIGWCVADCAPQNTLGGSCAHPKTLNEENDGAGKRKILIADDEKVIADTLAAILNMSGFETRAIYDGSAAVNALSRFEPDILISDVVMPGMTGIEAAIAIVGLCPSCKVLLFSGQAATADLLHQARDEGYSFEILAKPVHPAELIRKVRQSLSLG